ncbi:hypothetical protein M758_UG164200 [Ceratodon purpureus]|nr:hypothetical protein M758_UG164200 [Ceratodon purpureus]
MVCCVVGLGCAGGCRASYCLGDVVGDVVLVSMFVRCPAGLVPVPLQGKHEAIKRNSSKVCCEQEETSTWGGIISNQETEGSTK